MDNLRKSIQVIFGETCPDQLIQDLYDITSFKNKDVVAKKDFLENGLKYFHHLSFDEIENLHKKLEEDWFFDVYQNGKQEKSVYNLLLHFNKQVLKERNNQPLVSYQHLLRWRDLSFTLGEDIFTCSYFAYMDNRAKKNRDFFAWQPVIFSTNNRLKKMLLKGVAENHFHFKGSAPVFDLSWIVLMNTINTHHKTFKELKKEIKLNGKVSYSFKNHTKEIDILVYKACRIRLLLFEFINSENKNINLKDWESLLKPSSNKQTSFEVLLKLNELQNEVSQNKFLYGYKFNHKGKDDIADYTITKNMHIRNFKGSFLLYGERKLLYDTFKYIYSNCEKSEQISKLLHIYLLIKNEFRAELIQINKRIGFSNFSKYQDRKEYFIPEDSIYETAMYQMAINDTIKFQNIVSFETRIAPKNSVKELNESLKKYQRNSDANSLTNRNIKISKKKLFNKLKKEKHFYTIHFIKKKEENIKLTLTQVGLPRHYKLRDNIEKQAKAIVLLRESYAKKASLIKGIDAASSEFNTRPEVFAQVFRYLKDHKLQGEFNHLKSKIVENKLSATFHAGEDFYDIIDGIRSIDEVIKFLKFCPGDRIGHALALGINVEEYFNLKDRKIMLPKELLIDNISWLLAKIRKYNINEFSSEVYKLEKLFDSLFREIYQVNFDQEVKFSSMNFTHDIFYDAWKLRGDDPYLYMENIEDDVNQISNMTYWERCRINYFYPKNSNIRKDSKIKFLYQQYHFNQKIKNKGKEIKQFTISDTYIKLVEKIQKKYQHYIRDLNIGIECNPTSNYLIGTIDKYSKHPIKNFFNLHLETDTRKIKECPQIFVSINTDDQGIFGTSLENEYALLAIALEKEKDENGNPKYNQAMIYNWLDKIREMGLEQSFE
ncbi:hypothetical protein U8527_12355 [Kordia algicida OT-1]|uniref:adenosine deaminase n=1 Tax=Kordia algicida OT-1 TaxID=391587 RepID=A9CUL1_9FLAO|nr:hypothetical protein [Kordia algicida]EDP94098.1 hypothetical protein KAOT1_05907 [Kordia algicida OT-1]